MRGPVDVTSAAVIGWPVEHSLSPRIHNFWFKKYGIEGSYTRISVSPDNLAAFLDNLGERGFSGINVTIPHKESAVRYMDSLSPEAERIGAVNMVTVLENGELLGENSDGTGFSDAMTAAYGKRSITGREAVLLGAGGAARAVAVALLGCGVASLTIINRTEERGRRLAADLADERVQSVAWAQRSQALGGKDLLINATSLGMTGTDELDIGLDELDAAAIVADIVYRPLKTGLLARAQRRKLKTLDGLGMLLHQARPAFARWFGTDPDIDEDLRAHVLAGLEGA